MAKAKVVVSDSSSYEVDELRRQFNHLLVVLENIATSVDAGTITADEAFTALQETLVAGRDQDITNIDGGSNDYVGSGAEIVGVCPRPTPVKRLIREHVSLVDLEASSNF